MLYYKFLSVLIVLVSNRAVAIWNESRWADHQGLDCTMDHWIHIPKTGSTFCLSLQHVCCREGFEVMTTGITTADIDSELHKPNAQREFDYKSAFCYLFNRKGYPPLLTIPNIHDKHAWEPYDPKRCRVSSRPEHIPLNADPADSMEHAIVLIREPKARIISAFLDGQHHEGIKGPQWEEFKEKHLKNVSDPDPMKHKLKLATAFAHHPDLYGCQTKMILGIHCSAPLSELPENYKGLVEARLANFFFVGIADEFSRSLRLFHELSNKGSLPNDVESYPLRTTNHDVSHYLHENLQYDDPIDGYLYHELGKRIFAEEIEYVQKWKNIIF